MQPELLRKFNKKLIKRFVNVYEFCDGDSNKFILLLRKGVYSYHMNIWIARKRINETSLPKKEDFQSNLNMEGITNMNYRHAKRVYKDFKRKILGEYHDCTFRVMHYYQQIYLKTYEINVLKHMNLILLIFYQHRISMASMLKKNRGRIGIIN